MPYQNNGYTKFKINFPDTYSVVKKGILLSPSSLRFQSLLRDFIPLIE